MGTEQKHQTYIHKALTSRAGAAQVIGIRANKAGRQAERQQGKTERQAGKEITGGTDITLDRQTETEHQTTLDRNRIRQELRQIQTGTELKQAD